MWERLRTLSSRIVSALRMQRVDREFTEELETHAALLAEDHRRSGVPATEARRRALVELGGITQLREMHRDRRGLPLLDRLAQDARYALRMFAKSPAFSLFAGAALALGIGATTAVFSIADAVLIQPLPYRDPSRLVMVYEDDAAYGFPRNNPTPWTYEQWKARTHDLEELVALSRDSFNLTGDGDPEYLQGNTVTANFFRALGVEAAAGRTFSEADATPGAPPIAILSHALWTERCGADRSIVGRDVTLNGAKYTVIGVMPPSFRFLDGDIEVWVPAQWTPKFLTDNQSSHFISAFGRLRDGVPLDRARAELSEIGHQIEAANRGVNAMPVIVPMRDELTADASESILVLFGAVAFVLLMACANIANLLLARGSARTREMAVRLAVGASRRRVIEQMLVESVLLSCAAGGIGLAIGTWGTQLLVSLVPSALGTPAAAVNPAVLTFTTVVSIATGIIFGVLPAVRSSQVNLVTSLRQGSPQAGNRGRRLRTLLVVGEVAVAVVLLTGAALMIRSFDRLAGQDPGFKTDHVLTVQTRLPRPKYADAARRAAFYRDVLQRLEHQPGIVAAGYTTFLPLAQRGGGGLVTVEHRPIDPNHFLIANTRTVTPGYFRAVGMTLVRGRWLEASDSAQSLPVAVVNETMAHQYWPAQEAVGRRFKFGPANANSPSITVVGIAVDMRQGGMDVPVRPETYVPVEQIALFPPSSLAVRTSGDPSGIAETVRRAVWAVDPEQPLASVRTLDQIVKQSVAPVRTRTLLLGSFAASALLLAALGLYAVLSFVVAQRIPEIGVRVALGARHSDVMRLVIGHGIQLLASGMVLGLAAALALTRLMTHLLFNVSPADPASYAAVAAVLAIVTLVACYLPARRAIAVDPLRALRWE